ncbi:MAG: thioredoxin family protein [Deltaproteobacteria bacterium]|nr:thioredoxin family protein [Deltaproteobacteria bacterium]
MARKIEVFSAGCPICNETLKMVRDVTKSCGCEVIERRCRGDVCCDEAVRYGVKTVPTIAVDGVIVFEGRPTKEQARTILARY